MVLRRTLPSRLTGAPPAGGKPAANKPVPAAAEPLATPPREAAPTASVAPIAAPNAAALAAAAALVTAVPPPAAMPLPEARVPSPTPSPVDLTPVVPPAPVAEPAPTVAVAAPATAADEFGSAPVVAQRVLEDSFITPTAASTTPSPAVAAVAEPAAPVAPVVATAPVAAIPSVTVAEPAAAPVPVAPMADAAPAAPTPAVETTAAEPTAAGPTDFLQDNPFVASAPAVASRPPENPLRRRVNKPDRPRPAPPKPREIVAEETLPAATAPDRPTVVAAAPAAPTPNKPARQVTPRDFAAATVVAAAPAAAAAGAAPALDMAPEIPVDTRPLDRVDEELIASGIIAGPAGDTLTSQVPTSLAVAETPFPAGFLGETMVEPPAPPPSVAATPGFTLATAPLTQPPSGPFSSGLAPATPGAWEVEPGTPTPPPDIFKPQAAVSSLPAGFEQPAPGRVPPPTLPESRPSRAQLAAAGRPGTSWAGMAVAAAALGGVGLFVWHQATQPGGLENVNAQLAKLAQPRPTQLAQAPAGDGALLPPPTQLAGQGDVGKAQIEFAAPLPDPNQPIAANGTEAMPDDISMFAKLQREIQAARAEREGAAGGAATAPTVAGGATPAAPAAPLTKEQSDKELEQYRQLLASADPNTAPKPREFLRDPDAYMDGSSNAPPVSSADGALLPPPATRAEQGRAGNGTLPPPNELYTNNPKNLPIVAEPQMQEAPRIRQLEDFAAELFPQDTPKVKIPQGVRPQLAATDFPSLEVLSFVPGRGLIASANGKEGVLMVGESISGWQLTDVSTDMAEFRAGNRSYILTAQN
ncbi:MAG: hypothetical protein INF43_01895 [Alphaproteobacteria bacterium]|nr:hypothetical protein [Alphaproteobacteria bacterium]